MSDLLVRLYGLKDCWDFQAEQERQGILIRKPIGLEKHLLTDWVKTEFGEAWASEMDMALCNRPVSCFAAIKEQAPIAFACYDATALGYFGPIGVVEGHRGQGTGKALLLACLHDMKLKGYGYAVIGWPGEQAGFYQKTMQAIEIPDDGRPDIYTTMLRYPRR